MIKPPIIATGASYGALPKDNHARIAVEQALEKMAPCTVGSVLLFLTTGYAYHPQNAIKLAAKAAGTTQVTGCCAISLLTEQDWLLDVEGAVAMVFPQEYALQPQAVYEQRGGATNLLITLSTPNAATIAVNSLPVPQIGAIATDEYGHGPFSVWQSGRIVEKEFVHAAFRPELNTWTAVAESVTPISPVMLVDKAEGHSLIEVETQPAIDNLLSHLPQNLHSVGLKQPYNLLCAISENEEIESIQQGHYKLQHIVATDEKEARIHLSGSIKPGRYIFWALRDEQYAQKVMLETLQKSRAEFDQTPKFALMFPNVGRGSEFFNGRDRDLELFREVFPDVPMIGFYGNGEIAPGHRLAGLIHRYSTVFGLFA